MDSLVHPTQLSVWHRFLQARRFHKESSRSKNPDWYRSALELDVQLHLFVEGEEITDAQLSTRQDAGCTWSKIEAPSLELDEETAQAFLASLRSEAPLKRARSLGIVLHVADEFGISELARSSERPEDLGELSKQVAHAPQDVLEDHSISAEEISHRFFPYRGAKQGQQFGAAITISRKHHEFLRIFRSIGESTNFPVRTTALSAPLVALAALPRLITESPGQPFCTFLSYSTFSVIAFFSEEGNLVMLRSVRHHAGGTPPHVSRIIQTMSAALELPEPLVYVIPLASNQHGASGAGLPDVPGASVLLWKEASGLDPEVPLEFQGATGSGASGEEPAGLAASETYRDLADRQWATQDFLSSTLEEEELYPSQFDMKILRFGGLGLRAGAAVILLFLCWTGVRAFQVLSNPAWHHKPSMVSGDANQVLSRTIARYEKWNDLLADRSKAWVTMELLNQLFPNPKSVVLSETNHTVRPEVLRDQQRASLVKEWVINGFVNDEALEHLTVINTREGISKIFNSVYRTTGDESLRTDLDSRNLMVNLVASENKRYNPESGTTVDSQFPFVFNLTVTQQISAEDPIAVPTSAAP